MARVALPFIEDHENPGDAVVFNLNARRMHHLFDSDENPCNELSAVSGLIHA
jgi:hypothetical protein